ncbi:MAG TPA: tetratricopeptide repeat protein [Burkholderiales bacterium]|nr:tetratricopeptide repeat protein [Burkholderiales bacterium]
MKRLLLILLLAGCAQAPAPAPAPEPPPVAETPIKPAPQENVAIAGLLQSARSDSAAGRLTNAAATLERALRIEPRNPRLWHELAKVRLRQADYSQAESLAARSNTYAGTDTELRAANQKIIADARSARAQ